MNIWLIVMTNFPEPSNSFCSPNNPKGNIIHFTSTCFAWLSNLMTHYVIKESSSILCWCIVNVYILHEYISIFMWVCAHKRVKYSVCSRSNPSLHVSQAAVSSHFMGHWQQAGAHLEAGWSLLNDSSAVLQDSLDLSKWWHQRHSILCVCWWKGGGGLVPLVI